jgi:glycosyltransferase involved in cell wall biosynthesis
MEKRLKIALYSPYVPEHMGGGERQFFSVAEILSQDADVTVLIPQEKMKKWTQQRLRNKYGDVFGLDLKHVAFQQSVIGTAHNSLVKLQETSQFDVFYYLTDGSLFFSLAKRNILHIQFPFTFSKNGAIERLKLSNWSIRNTNSAFTKHQIEKAWNIPVQYVHYPYVDSYLFHPDKKEKIILSVGRFFSGEKSEMHSKRQDVLVEAFRTIVKNKELEGWKLVLIGSVDEGADNEKYAEKVAFMAKGLPIKIFHNASLDLIRQYYSHASIYWHAAGYEIDEDEYPTKVEHFGISPIEAMSSGAVPIVVGKGGLKEIVDHGENGYLWQTKEELIRYTRVIASRKDLYEKLSTAAIKRASYFSKKRFAATLWEMVK